MREQIHSSALAHKLEIRRKGMGAVFPGGLPAGSRVWMPCSGPGVVAEALSDLWPVDRIDPVDKDLGMKRRWEAKFPGSECAVGDAAKYEFSPAKVYSVADIDPFGGPAHIALRFMSAAALADPCLVIVTDGSGQQRGRQHRAWDFDEMRQGPIDSDAASEQQANLPEHIRRWMAGVTGRECEVVASHRFRHMWYVAIQCGGGEPRPAVRLPKRIVSARVPQELFARIETMAVDRQKSRTVVLRELITVGLAGSPGEDAPIEAVADPLMVEISEELAAGVDRFETWCEDAAPAAVGLISGHLAAARQAARVDDPVERLASAAQVRLALDAASRMVVSWIARQAASVPGRRADVADTAELEALADRDKAARRAEIIRLVREGR